MASFGPFAGLASAAIGALCSYETYALSLSDLSRSHALSQAESAGKPFTDAVNYSSPDNCKRRRWVEQQHKQDRGTSNRERKDCSTLRFTREFDGLDWFETIIS